MVDSFDLFCRLSRGAKYDRQRLSKELAAFKVISITPPQSSVFWCYGDVVLLRQSGYMHTLCLQGNPAREEQGNLKSVAAALDFFGDGVTAEEKRTGKKREKKDQEKKRLGKRKRERG